MIDLLDDSVNFSVGRPAVMRCRASGYQKDH
jgi:hypothetical protein